MRLPAPHHGLRSGRAPPVLLALATAACEATSSGGDPPAFVDDPLCDAADLDASPGGQPPFDLVFKIHGEPLSVDGEPGVEERDDSFGKRFNVIERTLGLLESHGARATIHANGEFFEYVVERALQGVVQDWLARGHHVGVHSHGIEWEGAHDWRSVPTAALDEGRSQDLWEGHHRFAAWALGETPVAGATPHGSEQAFGDSLMRHFGYSIMGGGPNNVADDLLGHEVWNPWRYATGSLLGEDLGAFAVLVPHRGQVGIAAPHGPLHVYRDNTPPHIQVMALQAWLERLAAVRYGDPPRRWVFGFLHHDNAGGGVGVEHLDEIDEVLTFLDVVYRDVSGGRPPGGCFATFDDVHERFVAWEGDNPGASSFRYEEGDPYPYHLAGLAAALRATPERAVDHEAIVASPDPEGTYLHRLRIRPRDGAGEGHPAWLVWREDGASVPFDLAPELAALGLPAASLLDVMDGETGQVRLGVAPRVPSGRIPVLVWPASARGGVTDGGGGAETGESVDD